MRPSTRTTSPWAGAVSCAQSFPNRHRERVGLAVTTGDDVLSGHPLRAINLSTDPADMGSRNVRRIDRCRRSQQVGCRADSDDEGVRQKKRLQRQLAII